MKTLIKNALVIPMTEDNYYFRGDILLSDGKIGKIGKSIKADADEVIDASSMIALPAFINAHTHLAMVLMRNYKDDKKNLQDWLAEIFPIEDKLNEDDILKASRLGIAELVKGGCTTFLDMYFMAHETVKAVKEAGINASLGLTVVGDGKSTEERYENRLPLMEKERGDYKRIVFNAAPHAIYTTEEESYRMLKEIAEKDGMAIHTHISETRKEVEDSLREHGKTPLLYLDSIDAISKGNMILAHGVHLTDEELRIVKEKKLSVVNNPASNMKLISGALDVQKLIDMGINVALGTDGASSNNNLNMLKEINIAALSASLKAGVPVSAYDVLKMATVNGAKALHLDYRLGTIEEGKDADIVLISTEDVNMNPLNNPFSAVVYSATNKDIKAVFSLGRKVAENGKITYADEKAMIRDVNAAFSDIARR